MRPACAMGVARCVPPAHMPFPNGGTPMGLPHRRRDALKPPVAALMADGSWLMTINSETQRETIKNRLGDVVAEAFVNLTPEDYWWSIGFW